MRKIICCSLGFVLALAGCAKREASPGASASSAKKSAALSASSAGLSAAALPAAGVRLSDMGFRCEIAFIAPPVEFRLGGAQIPVKVKVTKRTSETWPSQQTGSSAVNAVNLAYHWLDEKTGKPVKEGGRTQIPAGLADGASIEMEIQVASPGEPGAYVLKVEPVQEGVAWFSEKSTCYQTTHIQAKL